MIAAVTVVAALASFGCIIAAITCVVLALVKKSLPYGPPIAMIVFALVAAASSVTLEYWWWAAGETILVVLGVTILVFAVRLKKLRDQIREAQEAHDARRPV